MKKIVSLLIIAVMMILSLASCDIINNILETVTAENQSGGQSSGDGSENNKGSGDNTGTENGGNTGDNGNTDNTEDVRTTITEDEWDALDEITNFTVNMIYTDTYKIEDGNYGTSEVTSTSKQTETASYTKLVEAETTINAPRSNIDINLPPSHYGYALARFRKL